MNSGDVAQVFAMMMENVHTVIPATVVSSDGKRVKARPSIGLMLDNGQKTLIPDLEEVPLLMLGSGGFSVELELATGDPLLLLVIGPDASLWKKQKWGDPVHAGSPVRFNLNGCVAIPLCLGGESRGGSMKVSKDGTVKINGHLVVKP